MQNDNHLTNDAIDRHLHETSYLIAVNLSLSIQKKNIGNEYNIETCTQ